MSPRIGEHWWVMRRGATEPCVCQLRQVDSMEISGWFMIGHDGWVPQHLVDPIERVVFHGGGICMRKPLPNRRPCVTETVFDAAGKPLDVCCGFDAAGKVREIFADGHKVGSDARAELSDALVMASVLLQHDMGISDLSRHVGRDAIIPGAPAASTLGLAIDTAARVEATL